MLLLALVPLVAIFVLIADCFSSSKRLPEGLPWVGVARHGYFKRLRAYLKSLIHTHDMIEEGYKMHSKAGQAFVLPIAFTGAEIMLPPASLDWISEQPEDVLSGFEAHREFMRADWTLLHPTIIHEHIFQSVISRQLTRHLDTLEDDLKSEIPAALDAQVAPDDGQWHEVDAYYSWKKSVLQVVSRIYVGDLCRDPDYINNAASFNQFSMLIAGLIGLVPRLLRPLLAPLICLPDRYYHYLCARKTRPLLRQRLQVVQRTSGRSKRNDLPNDLITWAAVDAFATDPKAETTKHSLTFLAARLSVMNFVSIDSTTITLGNVLFDIICHSQDGCTSDDRTPLWERLRNEAINAIKTCKANPQQRKKVVDSLPLLDACLKESFRMGNFISRTSVKMVMQDPGVQVPGVGFVPKGVKVGIPLWGMHHDVDTYPEPYRWSSQRWLENPDRKNASVWGGTASAVGHEYIPFGFRRSSCPGRFFAMRVVKLMMIHLLIGYEFENKGVERPQNAWLGVSRGPPLEGRFRIRRRLNNDDRTARVALAT